MKVKCEFCKRKDATKKVFVQATPNGRIGGTYQVCDVCERAYNKRNI